MHAQDSLLRAGGCGLLFSALLSVAGLPTVSVGAWLVFLFSLISPSISLPFSLSLCAVQKIHRCVMILGALHTYVLLLLYATELVVLRG